MQEGHSNWSNSRPGFTHSHTGTPYMFCNCTEYSGNHTQNTPRSHGPMSLNHTFEESFHGTRNNISQIINGWNPLMHHARTAGTHGQSIRSWLTRSNYSERIPRVNTAESVVINFENINEPSVSYPQQYYGIHENKPVSNEFQVDFSSVNVRSDDPQIFGNQLQERNSSAVPNSNNDNNNANVAINQTSEGTQADNPNLGSSPEAQAINKFLHKYIPFTTFLLAKAIYDHREGILIFIGLLTTFVHANSVMKREIAKQNRRSLLSLSILFVNLCVCICFIYFVFKDQQLYKSLIFIPSYSQPLSIWDLLWMVGITDFVLKFITIQLKVGMACFPAALIPFSARGKWYLLLECVSQLYRGLAPIQPWLYYLMEAYRGPEKAVGVFFSVAYIVSKGTELLSKVKLFLKAFFKLVQNSSLGVRPSKEQLDTAGSHCPICHDEYIAPVLLNCRHVFCEACVTTWFDREQTCPLCRAKIADDPSWRDGATSFYAQFF